MLSGVFRESLEISGMRFFDLDNLPAMLFSEKEMIRLVLSRLNMEINNELA
jgi:hypothetical protein